MESLDAYNLVQEYLAGASVIDVAKKAGVSRYLAERFLRENNVQIRTVQEQRQFLCIAPPEGVRELFLANMPIYKVAERFGVNVKTAHKWRLGLGFTKGEKKAFPIGELTRMYVEEGISENALAAHFKTSRGTIRAKLAKAGVISRGRSEAESLKWSQMSKEQRLSQVSHAHEMRKGRFEADVCYLLTLMGHPNRQTVAVGPYYVDVALDELPVAVEVETRYGFAAKHRRSRIKHILDAGWALVYIPIRSCLLVHKVGPRLQALVELARRDKSIFGKYGVIGCDSIKRAGRHFHFAGIPRIPGF